MTKSQEYPSQVFWDERDEGFVAIASDLPGCSAFGKTKAKALKELDFAIEAWIATAVDAGEPVPEPSKLPVPNSFSGKVLLRLPKSLHENLAKRAESENVSLNQWMVTLLASNSLQPIADPVWAAGLSSGISRHMLLSLPANKPVVFPENLRLANATVASTAHGGAVGRLGQSINWGILISNQIFAAPNIGDAHKIKDL
jgi:predicted RNase H-like HicB family nuclease